MTNRVEAIDCFVKAFGRALKKVLTARVCTADVRTHAGANEPSRARFAFAVKPTCESKVKQARNCTRRRGARVLVRVTQASAARGCRTRRQHRHRSVACVFAMNRTHARAPGRTHALRAQEPGATRNVPDCRRLPWAGRRAEASRCSLLQRTRDSRHSPAPTSLRSPRPGSTRANRHRNTQCSPGC